MVVERTLSIIKPNAVSKNLTGKILAHIEDSGLKIIGLRRRTLTEGEAREFYAVHKERPFYTSLVKFMTSGPVVVSCLTGENAVARHREVMGATDPAKASPGTIRKLYGESVERNAVHGSDSAENGRIEVAFFFKENELAAG